MKFRQLTLNPFHRSRGKSKKKPKKSEQLQSKNGYDNSYKDQNDLDQVSPRNEFVHVKDKDLVQLDLQRQANNFEAFDQDNIEFDIDIKTQYRLDNYFYPLENEQNLEQIDNFAENKCSFCNLSSGCLQCETWDKNEKYFNLYLVDAGKANSDIDPYSNTIPKARSRIKTNPWLPSPKLSPETETGGSPADTLSSTDSNSSDTESNENDISSSSDDNCIYGGHSNDFFNLCSDERKLINTVYERPSALPIQTVSSVNKSDHLSSNLIQDFVDKDKGNDKQVSDINYRWSIISEGDISIDLNSPTIEDLRERFSNLEHNVSFQYEESLDSALESEASKRNSACLSINDLLIDDNCVIGAAGSSSSLTKSMESSDGHILSGSVDLSPSSYESGCVMTDSDNSESQTFEMTSSLYSEDDDPQIRENCNMDDSIDAGYSSLSRDGRISSDSDSDSANDKSSDVNHDDKITKISAEVLEENVEEGYSEDEDSEFSVLMDAFVRPSGRAFAEVKLSLEEKVKQLRLEKMIVQQKIREAQEAEKIRLQERLRFKQQISSKRKDVLIQTLNNLKERLEDQGDRLQKNYSAVLTMQKRYSRRQQPFLFVSPNHVSTTHVA